MKFIEQFQINIYAVIMLAALLIIIKGQSQIVFQSKRLLTWIIAATLLSIVTEPLSWIFDGTPTGIGFVLNHIANALLVLLAPVIAGLFAAYIDLKINNDWRRLQKRYFYQIAALIVAILLLINLAFPLYFTIDPAQNHYEQLMFHLFNHILVVLIYLTILALTFRARDRIETNVYRTVFAFLFIPIIGMAVQAVNIHLNFSWTTVGIAILIAYTFLESSAGEKDFLTGIYSRSIYDRYVSTLISQHVSFRLMMTDLNDFKGINDEHGHLAGDLVLKEFSRILLHVFDGERMVARLAGDEFIIVIEHGETKEEDIIAQITAACTAHHDPLIQNLRFSYGLEMFTPGMPYDELYTRVDEKMYRQKKEMKRSSPPTESFP
ncbi:MAG: GGDEF domain-containing protein [Sphaerochaetaceae bacterium]|nr:GGDEF domain-containing protein [Sphaerochaetaceae bacterium]